MSSSLLSPNDYFVTFCETEGGLSGGTTGTLTVIDFEGNVRKTNINTSVNVGSFTGLTAIVNTNTGKLSFYSADDTEINTGTDIFLKPVNSRIFNLSQSTPMKIYNTDGINNNCGEYNDDNNPCFILINSSWVPIDTSTANIALPNCKCFVENTPVLTDKGIKMIQDITSNDSIYGKQVDKVVKSIALNDLTLIKKDAFGPNTPSQDTTCTSHHKLFVNNRWIKAMRLVNGSTVLAVPVTELTYVYHIKLENNHLGYMNVNNLFAETQWDNRNSNIKKRNPPTPLTDIQTDKVESDCN